MFRSQSSHNGRNRIAGFEFTTKRTFNRIGKGDLNLFFKWHQICFYGAIASLLPWSKYVHHKQPSSYPFWLVNNVQNRICNE